METELISSLDQLSSQEAAGLGAAVGMLAGVGIVGAIVGLVLFVLLIIATWKVFTKAGEKGWKCLIPIYSTYILFKIAGRNFWKWLLIYVAYAVVFSIATSLNNGFGTFLAFVAFGLSIWGLVEAILMYNGLSKNFGHGAGFTVGLIFLCPIFMMILGFGSSQYIGNKAE